MEKENYETYEYLPASGSNSETEPYQFFVVQDDGTFLINRQVQYVTQVQADKEPTEGAQTCTLLDVAPQQFYVDVDAAGEIIAPEQFSVQESTNNLYAGSYLLQSGTADSAEQITFNTIEQLKTNLQEDNSIPVASKQANNLTEITLSDEQYRLLEEKGWILLETNEKVYVLDAYGLHDITTNDKLLQKFKVDNAANNLESDPSQLKMQYLPLDSIDIEMPDGVQSEEKFEPATETECDTNLSLAVGENKEEKKDQTPQRKETEICTKTDTMQETLVNDLYKGLDESWKDGNVLRIRTDFCLKDIPDKLILGKTKNGKRLVCKILKPEIKSQQSKRTDGGINVDPAAFEIFQSSIPTSLADVGDEKLDAIFRTCFEDSTVKYSKEDITFANRVVKQLLRLPAVRTSVVNRNILVTKVTVNEKASLIIESSPTIVTGKVSLLNKEWRFWHKPDLYDSAKQELSQPLTENGVDHNFLHIHIHEIQRNDKVVRTAVTLDKRRLEQSSSEQSEKIFIPDLPLNAITNPETENTMYGYACGICATIFETEKLLDHHRKIHKIENNEDDKTTVDPEKTSFIKNGILVLADPYNKNKIYACMQCKAKFPRLNNCQRHVKTHMAPTENKPSNDKKRVYKCKICYSFFHHAPTLLKHIMKNHIKVDK